MPKNKLRAFYDELAAITEAQEAVWKRMKDLREQAYEDGAENLGAGLDKDAQMAYERLSSYLAWLNGFVTYSERN